MDIDDNIVVFDFGEGEWLVNDELEETVSKIFGERSSVDKDVTFTGG